MTEPDIVESIVKEFSFLNDKINVQRSRRIWINVEYDKFFQTLDYITKQLKFIYLLTVTGLDSGDVFEIIYHIGNDDGIVINLKTSTPRQEPKINTVTEYFEDAGIYEKELMDLFGIIVENTPDGPRYPLPDDWPEGEYPLRKDWIQKESEDITNG